jgi:signal peptidase I
MTIRHARISDNRLRFMNKTKQSAPDAKPVATPTRRELKHARQLLHHGRKLLRADRDLLTTEQHQRGNDALMRLEETLRNKDWRPLSETVAAVERQLDHVKPPRRHAAWRENLEAIFVAIIIAGAIRTYFVQPFKIPTGSMQPTLYGIHPGKDRRQITGDRILVDRFTYNFVPPKRGDIIVFRTRSIKWTSQPPSGDFYIKRLVGLSGEKIQLRDRKLLVDGLPVNQPPVFHRILSDPGYNGYQNMGRLASSDDFYIVGEDGYFALGDNTQNSQDSRFWGDFPRKDVIGKAFFIYWPLSKRLGLVN